jgi:hypothetical protein
MFFSTFQHPAFISSSIVQTEVNTKANSFENWEKEKKKNFGKKLIVSVSLSKVSFSFVEA